MRARVVVAAFAVAVSLGCSSGGTTASASGAPRQAARTADVITQDEIGTRASDATNALQIVQKLRPQMLRSRGVVSPSDPNGQSTLPTVYVDNVMFGAIESLSNINASQVREIRYINARDATTQWGTNHIGGVILVTTRK